MKVFRIESTSNNKFLLQQHNPTITAPNSKIGGNLTCLPANYYPLVNFEGIIQTKLADELLSLKGVHCPLCGVEMVSKDLFETILADISKINSKADFIELISKYKNYINSRYYPILNQIKTELDNSELPLEEIFKNARNKAAINTNEGIAKSVVYLQNEMKSGGYTSQEYHHLEHLEHRIQHLNEDVARRNLYVNLIGMLKRELRDFSAETKLELFSNIIKNIKRPFFSESLFLWKHNFKDSDVKTFCESLFYQSKSDLRKALAKQNATPENLILTCNHCEKSGNSLTQFSKIDNKYFYNYVYELAEHSVNGNLPSRPEHPVRLTDFVKRYTRNKLSPDASDPRMKKLYETLNIPKEYGTYFPIARENGQPCAYCGQPTINHETKLILQEAILNTNTPKEIFEILEANKDIIRPKYNIIIDYFDEILYKNPNATEEEVVDYLRREMFATLLYEIGLGKQRLNKEKGAIQLTSLERSVIKELSKYLKSVSEQTFDPNVPFDMPSYQDTMNIIANKLESRNGVYNSIWKSCYGAIENLYSTHFILYPPEPAIKKLDSTLKVIGQNILRRSQAVADRLEAISEYTGPKIKQTDLAASHPVLSLNNVVLACKECNQLIRIKGLRNLAKRSNEMVENFKSYLIRQRENPCKNWDAFEKYDVEKVAENFKKVTYIDVLPLE